MTDITPGDTMNRDTTLMINTFGDLLDAINYAWKACEVEYHLDLKKLEKRVTRLEAEDEQ